jgi:hypothetical protein
MKIIDDNGMVWEMTTNKAGHTKIQCLDGLAEMVNDGNLKHAKENGYYCQSWEEALQILDSAGYVALNHPITICKSITHDKSPYT